MQRIHSGFGELIAAGHSILGPLMTERVRNADFFTGVSPVFAGLEEDDIRGDYGTTHTLMHVSYPWHTTDRSVTVSIPSLVYPGQPVVYQPWTIVHELGHVLDYNLGFEQRPMQPITEYATTNGAESFAEFFTAYFCPDIYSHPVVQALVHEDKNMLALLDQLTGRE